MTSDDKAARKDDAGPGATVTWLPDLLYVGGRFERGRALVVDPDGRVLATPRVPAELTHLLGKAHNIVLPDEGLVVATRFVRLKNRALLPGMVNAHSHAFQRVIRGRTEHRSASKDSFWTWREAMYAAAARLAPEDLYDASRMAFTEMALSGITSVGEFHYLHRAPGGAEYDDPNLLAKQVVRAARDVGLRVALLRVFYARSGFETPPNERQRRFIEPDPETFIRHTEALLHDLVKADDADDQATRGAWVGVAPHSVRAVAPEQLREARDFAAAQRLPVHMHVAEQPAEVAACRAETGRTPVALLADEGVLSPRFTGVHAVHVTQEEARSLARAGAVVCACPTTERNLGDGVVPADLFFGEGVRVALGTDSHTQIDLLEDARELEYHLRLQRVERNVLAPGASPESSEAPNVSALAARLFECATVDGARSIGAASGALEPGRPADFFTADLDDPSIAGAGDEDLLSSIVFSLARTAVREVAVGGRLVVEEGRHRAQHETVTRFNALQKKLWL